MSDKETVHKEPNKFSKSVGAGMKTVFGGKGRTYYVLEHKAGSDKHRVGEMQEIIIDYVELGRNPDCQVCFGDTFPTVSRQHAAIYREGNAWILKHLSKNNPTLINGRPVKEKWYLQSGDEIQLSMEGPKLGFIIPSNPFVNSIGLSRRLSLFRQQALRPYKQVLVSISLILLLAVCMGGFFIYQGKQNLEEQKNKYLQQRNIDSITYANQLENLIQEHKNEFERMYRENAKADQEIVKSIPGKIEEFAVKFKVPTSLTPSPQNIYDQFKSNVYFLQVVEFKVIMPDGTSGNLDLSWTGSGFLLADGRFFTARHCLQWWRVLKSEYKDQPDLLENICKANFIEQRGGKIIVKIKATSPNNTFYFTSDKAVMNDSGDKLEKVGNADDGTPINFRLLSNDFTDIAYIPTSTRDSKLQSDPESSNHLEAMQKVIIMGYSYGNALQGTTLINPLISESKVAQPGLVNGLITLTDRNFGPGCSGGPVLTEKNNNYYVIGVVSAALGAEIGMIVPISAIK